MYAAPIGDGLYELVSASPLGGKPHVRLLFRIASEETPEGTRWGAEFESATPVEE